MSAETEKDIFKSTWFRTRPKFIKEMVRKKPLGKYLMLATGLDYYVPHGYNEDGTMSVIRFNHKTGEPMWKVFGVNPETLLPIPESIKGANDG